MRSKHSSRISKDVVMMNMNDYEMKVGIVHRWCFQ